MNKIYNSSMPIDIANDNCLRLSSYGFAYHELKQKYNDMVIVNIEEKFWDNTQNETRNFNLTIEYKKESEIN